MHNVGAMFQRHHIAPQIVGVMGPQQFFYALVGVTSFCVILLRWQ